LRMLESGGLYCDFEVIKPIVDRMAQLFSGDNITITTSLGTNITANVSGRACFAQYGCSLVPGQTSSPPDIECALGANAGTMNGTAYIDGSIPHPRLGLIKEPIRLEIQGSRITSITGGQQAEELQLILDEYGSDEVYHIGEIGIGMNNACQLTGRMLEDEGCAGTVHLGIGDDRTFGGSNACPIHLDAVFCNPTLSIDGRTLLKDGQFYQIE